jgi:hypothetical protein
MAPREQDESGSQQKAATPGKENSPEISTDPQEKEDGFSLTNIKRRTVLGIGMVGLMELLFTRFNLGSASAQPVPNPSPAGAPESYNEGTVIQLPPSHAVAYMERVFSLSEPAQKMKQIYEEQGYQFFFDRARVYLYEQLVDGHPVANLLGILPSFVVAKRSDAFHRAVGISVGNQGGVMGGGVKVEHNPFRISEFSISEFNADGEFKTRTVTTDELSSLSEDEVAKRLGDADVDPRKYDAKASPPPSGEDQNAIVNAFFQQLPLDPLASPLYPPDGLRSLMEQIPLMQKFARVNQVRYNQVAALRGGSCSCSSSSCNWCTSTSSIEININISRA